MKRLMIICAFIIAIIASAKDITIKNPGYFKEPIRNGYTLFPDSLVFSSEAEEITIPDVGVFGRLGDYNLPNLKKVTFGDVDYIPGGVCSDMPNLEEIIFNGRIGHFDCTLVSNCPRLKKIVFRGPVSSTGGPGFLYNLHELDSVVFESVVADFGCDFAARHNCPKLKGITVNGAFLKVYNDSLTPVATIAQIQSNPQLVADIERLAEWQSEVLTAKNPGWMRKTEYQAARVLLPVLQSIGSPKADELKKSMSYAWNLGDEVKTYLDILKESKPYHPDTLDIKFEYAQPTDSLLTLSRERFNLDSVAGNGDDISRIKNLMYWVHNNYTHDGSVGIPDCRRNMRDIYDACKRDSVGTNCRGLAICLTEALLAEGIPARYITCLPKAWDSDEDCHVICVAWSESLGKWIWVDPTFAAFVSDENGMLLHPGEVRYRLQNDMPLFLNNDANWNNLYPETKEDYIDEYMTKNLYILQANSINQAEPEWDSLHQQGVHIALIPEGCKYTNTDLLTTNEDKFWQSPLP